MSDRPIFDVINVTVTRSTTTVSRQGFGRALILAAFAYTLSRVITVSKSSWATTLASYGFTSGTGPYQALSDHFAQEPSPTTAYLGRVNADRQDLDILTYDVGTTYKCIVTTAAGSTTYSVIAQGSVNATATALAAVVDAHASVSAVAVGPQVQVTASVLGTAFYIVGEVAGGAGTMDLVPTVGLYEDLDDTLTACKAESQDWYGIIGTGIEGRTLAQEKLIATWAESNDRLYIVADDDNNIRDTTAAADTSTTIAGYCKAQSMKNTAVIFHTKATSGLTTADEYIDAAWLGRCLPRDPGTINWNFRNLASVTVDSDHTPTRRTYMGQKGCSWYESFAGVACTQVDTGKAQNGYGDFIDITHIAHWTKFRIAENVAELFTTQDKVPYTDAGIASIVAEIKEVGQLGVENGAFTGMPTISYPTAADVASSYKATRSLPSVNARFIVSGAINDVAINVNVAL